MRTLVVCPYYINTGMFDGVTTKFPSILPIMDPTYVVNNIIYALVWDKVRPLMRKGHPPWGRRSRLPLHA